MTLYIVGLVIAFVAWAITATSLTVGTFDNLHYPWAAQKAKQARLAWLSFFLLPLYPAVVCVALILGPIMIFRRLGRISKKEEEV